MELFILKLMIFQETKEISQKNRLTPVHILFFIIDSYANNLKQSYSVKGLRGDDRRGAFGGFSILNRIFSNFSKFF